MFQASIGNRIAAGLFCVFLSACGGGGGSDSNTAAPPAESASMRSATGETPEGGPASTPTHPDAVQAPGPAGTPTASAQGDASAPAAVEADATRARFNQPLGIAVDDAGNLYIADALNHTIRKIAPSGVVTTLAGMAGASGSADGTGAAARFSGLKGIALDDAGNIYAVDHGAIRKITPSGLVTTLAGAVGQSGDADGAGPSARFRQPWGIAADAAGNLYVADTDNYLVRKITPSGTVSTHAGTRGMRGTANGSTGSATFLGPMGITADPAGNLYLTDWFGPPAPNIPEGSTFIRRIGADGSVTTVAGNFGGETGPAVFSDTFALAADADGNVMVATARSVRKVGPSGTVTTVAGPSDGFQALNGIAMDGAGNLFVTDASNHTVSKVTPDGTIAPVAGAPGQSGSSDEPATP